MASGNAPTVRQRRIGSALRKARDQHNLTVATVARRFGRSQGWLSMVENGLQTIAPGELADLLDFYDVEDGPLRESLLHLATHKPGSWKRTFEYRISAAALDLASLEEDAAEIRTFEPSIVPGLLQVPEYTKKLISVGPGNRPHNVQALVDFRISRQRVLHRPDPPRYMPIIAEAVLHNQVGGDPKIMRTQIRRLAEAARLDHVDLRVLPARPASTSGSAAHTSSSLCARPDISLSLSSTSTPRTFSLRTKRRSQLMRRPLNSCSLQP